jgi:hypothetical protein
VALARGGSRTEICGDVPSCRHDIDRNQLASGNQLDRACAIGSEVADALLERYDASKGLASGPALAKISSEIRQRESMPLSLGLADCDHDHRRDTCMHAHSRPHQREVEAAPRVDVEPPRVADPLAAGVPLKSPVRIATITQQSPGCLDGLQTLVRCFQWRLVQRETDWPQPACRDELG